MRRLLALERRTLALIEKFPPPPSALPDSFEGLVEDLQLTLYIIVLHHDKGWTDTNDPLQELARSVGMPEIFKSNFNTPGVADAVFKEIHERILTAFRALVETRAGKRLDDLSNASLIVEFESLYTEISPKWKNEYGLPTEFAEFSRRAAALFGDKPLL